MERDLNKIFSKATHVKLSAEELREMKDNLTLFVKSHPVRDSKEVRLIFEDLSKPHILLFRRLQTMAIALVIALLVGGGTSLAAEGSLPGDVLYPVKIGVNEKVRGMVALSTEAKAKLGAKLAERRLEEAERLAVSGRLDAEVRADIKARFENHAQIFEERVARVEADQNAKAAIEAHGEFEASLRAHEQVLSNIAARREAVRAEIEPILIDVRARLGETEQARARVEAVATTTANGEFRAAAEVQLRTADNKVEEVRALMVRMRASVSAEVYARAEVRFNTAVEALVRAKAEIEANSYGRAFVSLHETIRLAQEVELLLESESRLIEIRYPHPDTSFDTVPPRREPEGGTWPPQDSPGTDTKLPTRETSIIVDTQSDVSFGESGANTNTQLKVEPSLERIRIQGGGDIKAKIGL